MMEEEQKSHSLFTFSQEQRPSSSIFLEDLSLQNKYGNKDLKRARPSNDSCDEEEKPYNDLDETCDSIESDDDRNSIKKSLKKTKHNHWRDMNGGLFKKKWVKSQKFQTQFRLKDLELMDNQFDSEIVGQYRRTTSRNMNFFDPQMHKKVQMIENQMYLYKKGVKKMQ